MKIYKKIVFNLLVILIVSCKTENEINLEPRPAGKYLSEIWTKSKSGTKVDSVKDASFVYDSKRYLQKINYYDSTNTISFFFNFSYEQSGKFSSIKMFDSKNVLTRFDNFTYKGDSIMYREEYTLESNKLTFQNKFMVLFDKPGRPVKMYMSGFKNLDYSLIAKTTNIDTIGIVFFFKFNNEGDLISFYDTTRLMPISSFFEYDDMKNPFNNIGIDNVHGTTSYPWHFYINYIPKHNVTRLKYSDYSFFDFEIKYNGLYPVYEDCALPCYIYYFYKDL